MRAVLSRRRFGRALLATLVLAISALGSAAAQEFVVNERPALPHPTELLFGLESDNGVAFTFRPQGLNFGMGFGLPLESFGDVTKSPEAIAAQVQAFSDVKFAAAAIERALSEESLCGPDDSQHVEFYNGNGLVPRSFVDSNEADTLVLRWRENIGADSDINPGTVRGVRWCSGTYIGSDRFLTAGHCFRPDDGSVSGFVTPYRLADGARRYLGAAELAPLFDVEFRYQRDGQTSQTRIPIPFPVSRLVEFRNGDLDYAIVEIGPASDGRKLADLTPPAVLGDTSAYPDHSVIAVIQHPNGAEKRVASGHILGRTEGRIYYDDLDTQHGSSGAGVLAADGKLIAVHTNGGCAPSSPTGNAQFANAGVPLVAIRNVSSALPP